MLPFVGCLDDFPAKREDGAPTTDYRSGVRTGNQTWSTRNLEVYTYANGDSILHAASQEEFWRLGTLGLGAWTWPSGSPDSAAAHGLLYNWYAVADARGLAPQGWRVPTDEDWEVLATSLGSDSAGVRLKSAFGWSDAGNGTDDLGFSATPAGFRWHTGAYDGQGKYASWWTASDVKEDDYYAWYRGVGADYSHVHRDSSSKYFGFSVRLIRDGAD